METISVAKMRKAMVRYENSRYFFDAIKSTINDIICRTGNIPSHYFAESKPGARTVHIVIASDKGLAGGFNHNVLKHAWERKKNDANCAVFTVGQAAREFFESRGVEPDVEFMDAAYEPDKRSARRIAETVSCLFEAGAADEIYITYTRMRSSTSMTPETMRLLPFSFSEACAVRDSLSSEKEFVIKDIEYDPDPETVLKRLVPQYLTWVIFGALIQSSASEHCSRRYAMSNATKNASEILDALKIQYNQARQESITNELSEIITSSTAVK
jgi:F-type H+-transporting ATPase subunit gamma